MKLNRHALLKENKCRTVDKRTVPTLFAFLAIANNYVALGGPPGNDSCALATVVTNGSPTATGDNCTASATDDTETICVVSSNKDVWFRYTATCNGWAVMTTEGSAQRDTVLSAYGSCGGPELACDDDSGTDLLSQMTFGVNAGASYWVRLASYGNACGPSNQNITCISPSCGNDVTEPGEACDGIAAGSCNYGCTPNCQRAASSPDINSDSFIDLRDVAALPGAVGSASPSNQANLDRDGSVGLTDFYVLSSNLTGPLSCQGLDEFAFRDSIPGECRVTYKYAMDSGYAIFEAGRWCEAGESAQEVFTASLATPRDAATLDRVILICEPEQQRAYLVRIGTEGEVILFNGGGGVRIFEDRIELFSPSVN